MDIGEQIKEYMSEEKYKIRLHDFILEKVRDFISRTSNERLPLNQQLDNEEFLTRVKEYEEISAELCEIQALLCYHGEPHHATTISLAAHRISNSLKSISGIKDTLNLRWYPLLLLLYYGGLASISAGKYMNLRILFETTVEGNDSEESTISLLVKTIHTLNGIEKRFEATPGNNGAYTPRSNYLFTLTQPLINKHFIEANHESLFDRLEIFITLQFAYEFQKVTGRIWMPVGRFGWKYRMHSDHGPFTPIIKEVASLGANWPPFKVGLLGGSLVSFNEFVTPCSNFVNKLNWY